MDFIHKMFELGLGFIAIEIVLIILFGAYVSNYFEGVVERQNRNVGKEKLLIDTGEEHF